MRVPFQGLNLVLVANCSASSKIRLHTLGYLIKASVVPSCGLQQNFIY